MGTEIKSLDTRKGSRNICDSIIYISLSLLQIQTLILSFSLCGFSKIPHPPTTTFEFISICSVLVYIYMTSLCSYHPSLVTFNFCSSFLSLFIYKQVLSPLPFCFSFRPVSIYSTINVIAASFIATALLPCVTLHSILLRLFIEINWETHGFYRFFIFKLGHGKW